MRKNASGLGTYTTTFDLPAAWTAANGAMLSLGEVFDTFTVTVNGRTIGIDQIGAEGDIGPYLKAGRNTIAVRVATTLNNRLATIDEDVANRGLVQGTVWLDRCESRLMARRRCGGTRGGD